MDFISNVNRLYHDWNYAHPCVLFGLVRSLKPQVICDVGSYRGLSAAWMARACQENNMGRVYCIDNWSLTDHLWRYPGTPLEHCRQNLETLGVVEWVRFIQGDTDKVEWPEKVDFAYIDAWHSYEAAKHDFDKAASLGATCICLDDTTQSLGPRMLVQELWKRGDWEIIQIDRDCGLTICHRPEKLRPVTFSQELKGRVPGFNFIEATPAEQEAHLAEAGAENRLDYSAMAPLLHPGRGI